MRIADNKHNNRVDADSKNIMRISTNNILILWIFQITVSTSTPLAKVMYYFFKFLNFFVMHANYEHSQSW